jgi:hypothetical protein
MSADFGQSPEPHALTGLVAAGPDPRLQERLMLFAPLVGDWNIESKWFLPDGSTVTGRGEIHSVWILGGTAIQDVWSGRIDNPPAGFPSTGGGTTIRFYDAGINALRVVWINSASGVMQTFLARRLGDEIILDGRTPDGKRPERWILSAITTTSFEWRSVESIDDGGTWQLTEKQFARRVSPAGH